MGECDIIQILNSNLRNSIFKSINLYQDHIPYNINRLKKINLYKT